MNILCSIAASAIISLTSMFSMAIPTELTPSQLENGLLYELKPLAEDFAEIEEDYGINSAMYASVVALESDWGRSCLSQSKNNVTSYTCSSGYKSYQSKAESLYDMAENLSENYLKEEGKYFGGSTSIDDVACYYLTGKPRCKMNWNEQQQVKQYSDLVKRIYQQILRRAARGE